MNSKFSQQVIDIISYSRDEAARLGNKYISAEHLFLGIIKSDNKDIPNLFETFEIDLLDLKNKLEGKLFEDSKEDVSTQNIPLKKSAERVLKLVNLVGHEFKANEIESVHLFLAIIKEDNNLIASVFNDKNIGYDTIKDFLPKSKSVIKNQIKDDDEESAPLPPRKENPSGRKSSQQQSSETPVLDNFGIDITKAAVENRLDPIVGRENEIERLAQILSRRKKNNPILIGDPGVGKSAIAEGLALRIVSKKVSRILFDKRVVTLDLASIVAGTKYRGQFEERMKSILNELAKTNNVILFIDEIHTIVGAGGASGSLDAANMLKPALARGEIQCIGATTLDEYRQHIEKDGALERRFQKILVEPTSMDETYEILMNIKDRYEDHHNVTYTDDAIDACVKLTTRYISDRHLPDKAIDALDEAGSRVHITNLHVPKKIEELEKQIEEHKSKKLTAVKEQDFEKAAGFRDMEKESLIALDKAKDNWKKDLVQNREIVNEAKVSEVIAMMTGVPVQRIAQAEGERLIKMKDEIKGRVIGQDEAIEKITKAIQRNRAGLKDPNKPIGTFIFLGPTGVGKTHLAKILTHYLFDSQDALIRIDMSEYMEKFAVSRLVGAPPGYVGYEEGGQLTEKVRRKPYSVVLLDEIEKAHPDVFNILLQVLDEGQLTDSLGRKVDFKNTIIILTSNIGTRELKDFSRGIGFSNKTRDESDKEYSQSVIQKALKKAFSPEFLNRIDDVVIFNSLLKEHIYEIINIELFKLFKRVKDLGFTIELTEEAKEFIVEKGYDTKFGARPLNRAIQKHLEDPLAEAIIDSSLGEGDIVEADYDKEKDEITVNIKRQKNS